MRNDPMGQYKNGTKGIITEININDKKIKVRVNSEKTIEVEYVTWAHPKYNKSGQDETIIAEDTFKHFPLILGFALTIHREFRLRTRNLLYSIFLGLVHYIVALTLLLRRELFYPNNLYFVECYYLLGQYRI